MKKTLSILMLLMMLSFLFAQEKENTEVIQDSLAVAGTDSTIVIAEPIKELTEEEKLCKETAEGFMSFYEQWDTSRDYKILMPRIKGYVEDFYSNDPAESNKKNYAVLEENYRKIIQFDTIEDFKPILLQEQERINNELTGQLGNVALFGYIPRGAEDKIKIILEKLLIESSSNDKILSYYEELKYAYKNINRTNIGYNDLINKTYSEVTRVTDKRLNFLYIDDEVDEVLTINSEKLAIYVKSQKEKFEISIEEKIKEKYDLKKKAEEESNEDKIKQYHNEWLAAKGRTIDNVYTGEISRLLGVVKSFLKRPGAYDINDEFILKVRDNTPDLKAQFSTILKIKFYQDLVSKSKKYFRFEVLKGFRTYRTNVMIFTFLFFILFFYVFLTVKKKKDTIYIRRIPGLDALDDAIGRATEMGKPIIYDSGIGMFINPQTIASMLILRSVAKKVAEFKAEIIFPAFDPIVLQVAEEMIASGFLDAGYPEDHKKDNCFFMVNDQFAFAAGLSGLIARKKPATALHFGAYAAESLLIAEAGFAAGAIQVAGTVSASQLPFFITACDHTLIGEELYAAAAYMSRDAQVLSNLKLSDYGKVIFGGLFVIATILLTINSEWTFIRDLLETH